MGGGCGVRTRFGVRLEDFRDIANIAPIKDRLRIRKEHGR